MNGKNVYYIKKVCFIFTMLLVFAILVFYFAAGNKLKYKTFSRAMAVNDTNVGEITKDTVVEQNFISHTDTISQLSLFVATLARQNTGIVNIQLIEYKSNKILLSKSIDVSTIQDGSILNLVEDNSIDGVMNKKITIKITSQDGTVGNAITAFSSSSFKESGEALLINGQEQPGELCFNVEGRSQYVFYKYYWLLSLLVLGIVIAYCCLTILNAKKDKWNKTALRILMYFKYKFLLKQLVSRDFKKKYKRSVLGFIWSFLNPVLTMSVQYLVFSSLFKSNIQNFPVYLLIGSVFFGFFTEAVGVGIGSIVDNAALITKVYVPKYVYPITKVLATSINLLFSMVPLFLMIIITKVKITKSLLLLPYGILCIMLFTIGIVLALSSAMVFFRDTQFLWGIISMVWTYATPIFYPDSIIPAKYMPIYRLNPMYHFINFIRDILLHGTSPELSAFIICTLFAASSFIIGMLIFKKSQDRFILYI